MISYLIFGITYSFACVVQPGPFQAFLFSRSLTNGWRKTVPLVMAPLVSDLPVIILVLLILNNFPKSFLHILQCLGGVFLIYLAWNAYKTWRASDEFEVKAGAGKQNFLKAVMVNILNPSPYLGWSLVMGPLLIKGWGENPLNGIILLTGFYGSMIIYSAIMVVIFAMAGSLGPKVSRISIGISVLAFVIFGSWELWAGITAFI